MGELACDHCGAHLPVPFWKWNNRLPEGAPGPSGTVRCGVCGWRYELTRHTREWTVVEEHPPFSMPGRPRLDRL
jgi:hypothetical protein